LLGNGFRDVCCDADAELAFRAGESQLIRGTVSRHGGISGIVPAG
jgi:hypothetical protein